MKLTAHFSLEEATFSQTALRKGIKNVPDELTLGRMCLAAQGMERVRDLLGYGIRVSSWYRCPALNAAVGSKPTSDHVLGWAIDFTCSDYGTPLEVSKTIAASNVEFAQLIYEGAWVHISFNPAKDRSVLTASFDNNGHVTYQKGIIG